MPPQLVAAGDWENEDSLFTDRRLDTQSRLLVKINLQDIKKKSIFNHIFNSSCLTNLKYLK